MADLINLASHEDTGPIRLFLHADLRDNLHAVTALCKATSQRIFDKLQVGDGQHFEEGPVYLQTPPRPSKRNHACLYQMHFDSDACARMHIHPLGERLILVTPVSHFRIWSVSEFEVEPDLRPMTTRLPSDMCEVTKTPVFGVEVAAGVMFTIQIPPGTSHRFLGEASVISIHPNESKELQDGGFATSTMEGQTAYWTRSPPSAAECKPPARPEQAVRQEDIL